MKDPITIAEWQEASDAAEACLLLESTRQYGLVQGGPRVNVDRCVELLDRAKRLGVRPSKRGVDRQIKAIVRGSMEAAHGSARKT
jgi:hypothetical protein